MVELAAGRFHFQRHPQPVKTFQPDAAQYRERQFARLVGDRFRLAGIDLRGCGRHGKIFLRFIF